MCVGTEEGKEGAGTARPYQTREGMGREGKGRAGTRNHEWQQAAPDGTHKGRIICYKSHLLGGHRWQEQPILAYRDPSKVLGRTMARVMVSCSIEIYDNERLLHRFQYCLCKWFNGIPVWRPVCLHYTRACWNPGHKGVMKLPKGSIW